jgi:hypothetical protein
MFSFDVLLGCSRWVFLSAARGNRLVSRITNLKWDPFVNIEVFWDVTMCSWVDV